MKQLRVVSQFTAEAYGCKQGIGRLCLAGINMKDQGLEQAWISGRWITGRQGLDTIGTGKLQWAVFFLSKECYAIDNPNITLSPISTTLSNTAYGQTYAHNFFEPGKFGYFMDRAFDQQQFKGSDLPAPFGHSPVMSRLTMGDLCPLEAGDTDKNGKAKLAEGQPILDKEGKPKLDADGNPMLAERDSTSWDTQSYLYYMAHSVFNHIDGTRGKQTSRRRTYQNRIIQ